MDTKDRKPAKTLRGLPDAVLERAKARFWKYAEKTEGCWNWKGTVRENGYGIIFLSRKALWMLAHRFSYEFLNGNIPVGLTIDHLCRNRSCVNPSHLEPVTRGENVLRGVGITAQNSRKTHCPSGHPYDQENTAMVWGSRVCRICRRMAGRRMYAKIRVAVEVERKPRRRNVS